MTCSALGLLFELVHLLEQRTIVLLELIELALELAEKHPDVHVTVLPPGPVRTNIKNSLQARPAGEAGALKDVDLTSTEGADELPWMDPRTAGGIVARAVENDDLYAITHPQWWPLVQARVDRLRAEFDKYPPEVI